MQVSEDKFLEILWQKQDDRKFTVLCGGCWGDNGKGSIESAILSHFQASVRVSGGANTGRTAYIPTTTGQKKIIYHLIPAGWANNQLSVIGDWVLIDLDRLVMEIKEVKETVGQPKQPLYISKKAPLFLVYHSWLEAWLEMAKGDKAVGTTKRGIAPMIAGVDLRIGPLVGHLNYPDVLRRWVKEFYLAFEPIFKKMHDQGIIDVEQATPELETEKLLALAKQIKEYITDIDPILFNLANTNTPTLFGLTQGFGLHFKGTYPFNSATQTIAQATAYCSGVPMKFFGPVIQVEKILPTRVGAGPFPTGLWNRDKAMQFPMDHPELFSDLSEHDPKKRKHFLIQLRDRINSGQATKSDLAQYFMVLGNELGATTKRGREIGAPDLHMIKSATMINGSDCLALTRVDLFSELHCKLPIGLHYKLNGQCVEPPIVPSPIEEFKTIEVDYQELELDFRGCELNEIDTEEGLPSDLLNLIDLIECKTLVPVGIISTSPKINGKIFRQI